MSLPSQRMASHENRLILLLRRTWEDLDRTPRAARLCRFPTLPRARAWTLVQFGVIRRVLGAIQQAAREIGPAADLRRARCTRCAGRAGSVVLGAPAALPGELVPPP